MRRRVAAVADLSPIACGSVLSPAVAPTTHTPEHPLSFAETCFWWFTMDMSCAIEAILSSCTNLHTRGREGGAGTGRGALAGQDSCGRAEGGGEGGGAVSVCTWCRLM